MASSLSNTDRKVPITNGSSDAVESADDWKPGRVVGDARFLLERPIAAGGMGEVWLASDIHLGTRVALKRVSQKLRNPGAADEALIREIVRSRQAPHPNIVAVYDLFDDAKGQRFLVMEPVEGKALDELLKEQDQGRFAWENLKPICFKVCQALSFAHSQGVIHRDIKPSNILLGQDGQPKIVDFGLATRVSESLKSLSKRLGQSGTAVYMSPQQTEGWPSTPTDDLYALGVTLFELLTGTTPNSAENWGHATTSINERLVSLEISPDVPAVVADAVSRCLRADPALRPQSMEEFVSMWAPQNVTGKETVRVEPPESPETDETGSGKWRILGLVLTVGLVVGLLGLAWKQGWVQGGSDDPSVLAPTKRNGTKSEVGAQFVYHRIVSDGVVSTKAGRDEVPQMAVNGGRIEILADSHAGKALRSFRPRGGVWEIRGNDLVVTLGDAEQVVELVDAVPVRTNEAFGLSFEYVAENAKVGLIYSKTEQWESNAGVNPNGGFGYTNPDEGRMWVLPLARLDPNGQGFAFGNLGREVIRIDTRPSPYARQPSFEKVEYRFMIRVVRKSPGPAKVVFRRFIF